MSDENLLLLDILVYLGYGIVIAMLIWIIRDL